MLLQAILCFQMLFCAFKYCLMLLQAVRFLDPDSLELHRKGQQGLQQRLIAFIDEFGTCEEAAAAAGCTQDGAAPSTVDLPLHNLLFDGQCIWQAELTGYLQGVGMLCFD